jgi:putative ABC transport system permease protein
MIRRWALKGIVQARSRFAASTLAVGTAMLLVIVFRAVWEGETEQLAVYVERTGADVWVMQAHVSNMHMASSFISEGKRNEIRRVPGVDDLAGILYLNTMVQAGDRQWFSYVVGLEKADQIGGPWAMRSGTTELGDHDAIIPATLSRITDTSVGDTIEIGDRSFSVVGLSEGTFSVTNPITFVRAGDLADLLSLAGYDSYILVRAAPGVDPGALAEGIEDEVDGVEAMTTPELVASDIQLARQMGTEVIALMTAICAVLAVLLVAFALYIHTSAARRELAVVKALGFRRRHVYESVVLQSAVLTGAAFAFAVVVAALVAVVGPRVAPVLSLSLRVRAVLEVGGAALLVAVVSTLVVARRVARVEPASVFNP